MYGGVNRGMRNKYRILNGKLHKKYFLRNGSTDWWKTLDIR
jgi:hypothetical protein